MPIHFFINQFTKHMLSPRAWMLNKLRSSEEQQVLLGTEHLSAPTNSNQAQSGLLPFALVLGTKYL